jgi:hypothetical protein
VRTVLLLCDVYPGICLTTEEKTRENLSEGSWRMPVWKKFPSSYWTQKFIAAFTRARSCSSSETDKSGPFTYFIFWKFILLSSFHLSLGFKSGLFPSRFSTKTLYAPLLSTYVSHASSISFFLLISRTIFTFIRLFFIHLLWVWQKLFLYLLRSMPS